MIINGRKYIKHMGLLFTQIKKELVSTLSEKPFVLTIQDLSKIKKSRALFCRQS